MECVSSVCSAICSHIGTFLKKKWPILGRYHLADGGRLDRSDEPMIINGETVDHKYETETGSLCYIVTGDHADCVFDELSIGFVAVANTRLSKG